MRVAIKPRRITAVIAVLGLVVAACGVGATATPGPTAEATPTPTPTPSAEPTKTGPVVVCELAYYTGDFAPYGNALTSDVRFPIKEVINNDPPLGRQWELRSEDIGTVGEATAAKTCLDKHGAEIVVSIAHEYRQYRDFMMEYWQENDVPLGPSVHGGAIPGNLGGKASEPIFRAQGLDQGLGVFGSLYAAKIGAKSVVIFATQIEGFQAAANAAEGAAKELGITVAARMNPQAGQASYATEAQQIANLKPDAVIVQAGSTESATLIKQAAEAGLSLNWIGETGWSEPEFIGTLTTATIATQKGIGFASFTYNDTTPAWDFWQPLRDSLTEYTQYYDATQQYAFSTYDLMIQTALAVEAGGAYLASAWAPAMFKVGDPPGDKCYTYADCLKLIREGKDIDYEGVTGPGSYTDGGVNAVTPAYNPFNADGTVGTPVVLDAAQAFQILDKVKSEATCTPENPPNKCEWGG